MAQRVHFVSLPSQAPFTRVLGKREKEREREREREEKRRREEERRREDEEKRRRGRREKRMKARCQEEGPHLLSVLFVVRSFHLELELS